MGDNIWVLIPLFALIIPIVAILSGTVIKPPMELKRRQLEGASSMTAEKAAQHAAHSERLEARVRVLERLAVDRGGDLAGEIEALRGDRLPSGATDGEAAR